MTEKRFKLKDIGFVYDNDALIGMKEIVECLNALHEENKALCDKCEKQKAYVIDTKMQNIKLHEENVMLKQSATMYHNIFLELQKQMKGVRKSSDLDSKDFKDLIELSKGNIFDDEIGWMHLPVKEDFELKK